MNNSAPTEGIFIKFYIREFFENLSSKIFDERVTGITGALHMKTCIRLYLAEFFLDLEVFKTKVLEKIRTRILCLKTFSRKLRGLRDNVEKNVMYPDWPHMSL
jgi:hypothetical protein